MNSQSEETWEPLDASLTDEQIQKLINERKKLGVNCRVATKDGQRFLVCNMPPL